jgi:hypothetical protein
MMSKVLAGVVAIPFGLMPRRLWGKFPGLPVETMAAVSGILTAIAGLMTGSVWFLAYLQRTARVVPGAEREMAVALLLVSLLAFVALTPAGWFSGYLLVSGVLRFGGAMTDEPFGDPLLAVIDGVLSGALRGTAASGRARRGRGRLKSDEVPDRLYPASWAGINDAVYVVVVSRPKPDWTPGTFVITDDAWYTLGVSFEITSTDGRQSVYPLREHRGEVLRRSVRYRLPRLERNAASPTTS